MSIGYADFYRLTGKNFEQKMYFIPVNTKSFAYLNLYITGNFFHQENS